MNVTVDRDNLKTALARVKPAVKRNGLPVLAGVMLDANGDGTVIVTATNLDTTITTSAAGTVDQAGRVLVYHEPLERLVGTAPAGPVQLRLDDDDLHVTAGRAKARFRTLDAETFPKLRPLDSPAEAKLDDDWRAIQRVIGFRSTEPTRPILTGIHIGDGVVETTDSFRLARHDVTVDADLLLAPDAVLAAARIAPDGPVALRWDGRRFELEADGTVWAGSVIEGQFPPVTNLIPADPQLAVTVDRAALLAALNAVAAIDGGTSHLVIFQQDAADNVLTVRRNTQDVGDIDYPVDVDVHGDCQYAFNAALLAPLLGALHDDTVTLQGVDALKPWVVRESGFLGLIMPVRT